MSDEQPIDEQAVPEEQAVADEQAVPEEQVYTPVIYQLLTANPEVFEPMGEGCDDEDIDELENEMGVELPDQIVEMLAYGDGCMAHIQDERYQLASRAQLLEWHNAGVLEDLEVFPFGHNEEDMIFLFDQGGLWEEPGAVFGLRIGRRTIGGHPVQDALKLADNLTSFLTRISEGQVVC